MSNISLVAASASAASSSTSPTRAQQVTAQSMMLAPALVNEKDLLFSEACEFKPCLASDVRTEEYTDMSLR